jgi:urease accessory protein
MKRRPVLEIFAAACAAWLPLGAHAHHAMGGGLPGTAFEGFVSGLAHPIIGLDHFLFVLALGVVCHQFGQRIPSIAAFLAAALAGTLFHVQRATLPYAELWVAASLVVLGIVILRAAPLLRSRAAPVLFALAGFVHGYAYGESIVGAEQTPLLAYLVGFTAIQLAIALAGFFGARYAARRYSPTLASTAFGAGTSLVGVVLLLAGIAS